MAVKKLDLQEVVQKKDLTIELWLLILEHLAMEDI